ILHRERQRGAVEHPFLDKFRENDYRLWDLNWMRDTRHILNPKYGSRSRMPKLLTNQSGKKGLLDSTRTKTINWFHAFFKKSFPSAQPGTDFINEFFEEWISVLIESGILESRSSKDQESFAIKPAVIWIKKNVKQFSCDTCEQVLYAHDDARLIEGGSCIAYRCSGHYQKDKAPNTNYYRAVYNRRRFPRIYAEEHTGLLERETREKLEIDFKRRPRYNSVNTLVSTSTLEMGIDIGDLNVAYNNAIPPLLSNFLQRVGRAGRSSGSALIVNFAKTQNHDLFY